MTCVRTEPGMRLIEHSIWGVLLLMGLNLLGAAAVIPDIKWGEANSSNTASQYSTTKELPALSIPKPGASVPYIRLEAEDGCLSGAAAVVGPNRIIGDLGG